MLNDIWNFLTTKENIPIFAALIALAGIIVGVLLNRFLPWLWHQATQLVARVWAYFSGRGRDYDVERKYLNALITRHRFLGQLPSDVATRMKGHTPAVALEQAFVSLQMTSSGGSPSVDAEQEDLAGVERGNPRGLAMRDAAPRWMRFLPTRWRDRFIRAELPQNDLGRALAQHPRLVIKGDPGSGKTTLLKYLAVTCARARRNQRREGDKRSLVKERLGWDAKPFPIFVSLGQHGSVTALEPTRILLNACAAEFAGDFPAEFFERRLKHGNCLLLLDAFDELGPEKAQRGMKQQVEWLLNQYHPTNRIVVTTRIVGYKVPLDQLGFAEQTVQPLSDGQVKALAQQRYRAIALREGEGQNHDAQAALLRDYQRRANQLLDQLKRNPRVRELTTNPLLLSLIVLVHYVKVELPEQRHYLYQDCVRILTQDWRKAKDLPTTPDADSLLLDQKIALLQTLALRMQTQRTDVSAGQAPLPRRVACQLIAEQLPRFRAASATPNKDYQREAEAWLDGIKQESGILEEVGLSAADALIRFSHLTFQEYLAAVALREEAGLSPKLRANLLNEVWQEVLLLYAAISPQTIRDELAQRLLAATTDDDTRGLFIAARCLADRITLHTDLQQRIRNDIQQLVLHGEDTARTRFLELLSKVGWPEFTQTLLQIAEHEPSFAVRYAAAQALARLGDPRFEHDEPTLVTIPDEGPFTLGERDTAHPLSLPAYRIATYPVTNMEYQRFVDARGHEAPEDWEEGHYPAGKANHPVVYVSWDDARAYCHWLSQHTGKHYHLPNEAEWEKAARGRDGRRYPWGDDFDKTKCNTRESGIGGTTPVGLYLEGASPYGIMDVAGNVWEWCSSAYKPYPYRVDDGRENLERDESRVLRGGSWYNHEDLARCANRDRYPRANRSGYVGFRVAESLSL